MPLSETQMKYLALAWQCFETEPKIDYEKFHQIAGLASVRSAQELMRVTKNKLKAEYGALSGDMKTKNAATSTPKKAAGEGGVVKTPASRKKGTAKKRTKAHMEEDEGSAGESAAKKTKVKSEPEGAASGDELS